jgi:hypothetical protein
VAHQGSRFQPLNKTLDLPLSAVAWTLFNLIQ